MNQQFKNDIRVGIFVLGGLTLFATSILLLGGDKYFFRSTYPLKLNLKQAQGLVEGSQVSLSGVDVGLVEKIEFRSDLKLDITILVDKNFSSKITQSSVASVKTQGALGDKFLFIEPGSQDLPPLKSGDYLKVNEGGDLLDLISDRGSEISHLFEAIKEVHYLIKSFNDNNRTALIMENLVSSSDNLNKLLLDSRKILSDLQSENNQSSDLKRTLQNLASISEKLDSGQGTLGAIINDPTIHEKLISFIGDSPRSKFLKPLIRETATSTKSNQ